MKHPGEPSAEQCSQGIRVEDFEGNPSYAYWYPQMGGYVAKSVIVIIPDGNVSEGDPEECYDRCFEVYVWHDGAFPFDENDCNGRGPVRFLHHCMPSQFIGFGDFVIEKQKEHLK